MNMKDIQAQKTMGAIQAQGAVKVVRSNLVINQSNGLKLYCDAFIDGKLVKSFECHSLVGNFIKHLYSAMGGIDNIQYYDTSHTTQQITRYSPDTLFEINDAATDTMGIVVGTGSTAVNIADYNLATKIAHGTGSGQLSYSSSTVTSIPAVVTGALSAQLTLSRSFANASGGIITVNEIGLNGRTMSENNPFYWKTLFARDVIAGGITVPNGSTLTLNYRVAIAIVSDNGLLNQFLGLLYRQFCQTVLSVTNILDVGVSNAGSTLTFLSTNGGGLNMWGGGNSKKITDHCIDGEEIGVVVGTGNIAVTVSDRALQTKIMHGYTSGKMVHHGCLVDNLVIGASSASFTITRFLENLSGGSINVSEMGLYCLGYDSTSSFAISRKLLAAPVTVANNEILKAVCTISQTIS